MRLVYRKAGSVELIVRSAISRTVVELHPWPADHGFWRLADPCQRGQGRDYCAVRAELGKLLLLRNKQTPLPSSDTAVPYLFVALCLLGGIMTMCDVLTTLRGNRGHRRIQLDLLSQTGLPWTTARRRPAEWRRPPHRPFRQARCLVGGPPSAALAALPYRALHLQLSPTLRSFPRPRWWSRTSPVTEIALVHGIWKIHQGKLRKLWGGPKYAVAFSLCRRPGTE